MIWLGFGTECCIWKLTGFSVLLLCLTSFLSWCALFHLMWLISKVHFMCFLSKAEKRVCRVLKICCSSSSGMTSASSSSCVETGMYGALLSGPSGIYSRYMYCTQLAVLCSSLCEVSIPPPYGFYKYSIITNIFLILSLTLCSSPSFPCHLPLKMTVYNFCSKSRMTFFFSRKSKSASFSVWFHLWTPLFSFPLQICFIEISEPVL